MKYLIACTGALVVVAVVQSLAWTLSLKWWRRFVQGNREQRPNLGAYLLAWASSVGRHYTRWFSWPRKSDVEQQILKAGLSNLSYSTVVGAKVSFALLGIILGVMAGDFILAGCSAVSGSLSRICICLACTENGKDRCSNPCPG